MVPTGRLARAWRYVVAAGINALLGLPWVLGFLVVLGVLYWWGYLGPSVAKPKANRAETQCQYAQHPEGASKAPEQPPTVVVCFNRYANAGDGKAAEDDQTPPEQIAPLSRYVARRVLADPVALFTVVLALFTWRLIVVGREQGRLTLRAEELTRLALKASEKQAKAARRAANAAVRLELPIVRVLIPSLIYVDNFPEPGKAAGGLILNKPPGERSVVNGLTVRNDGRTRAFVDGLRVGYAVGLTLTDEPSFGPNHPTGEDTTVTDENVWLPVQLNIELSDIQIAAISNAEEVLWVYASVIYRDFMGDDHEARFCWAWRRDQNSNYWSFERVKRGEVPSAYVKRT